MQIQENFSLKNHNTFGLEVGCRYFVALKSVDQYALILSEPRFKGLPRLVLGGGSNLLLTRDFEGLVISVELDEAPRVVDGNFRPEEGKLSAIQAKAGTTGNPETLLLETSAGQNWHELVLFCVEKGWGGIENLSLIPGKVGAAPIQNIGAYGAELKDVFHSLDAMNLETGLIQTFTAKDCRFGYRESIFKKELKGKFLVVRVRLLLSTKPVLNTTYGPLDAEIASTGKARNTWTIKEVSEAVIKIRQTKLPDPKEIGNSGSFFKNPEISAGEFEKLKEQFPGVVFYPLEGGRYKIPAGWLIEQAGWKGKTFGNYGVHKNQALVLVNYGGAKGSDIFELSEKIQQSVKLKYGIELEREVNVL